MTSSLTVYLRDNVTVDVSIRDTTHIELERRGGRRATENVDSETVVVDDFVPDASVTADGIASVTTENVTEPVNVNVFLRGSP
jgi:predicted RNA-binding protein